MRTLRTATIMVMAVGALGVLAGCGPKPSPLDTAAPPPSNPNAHREVATNKRIPRAPGVMGNPGGK